MTRGWDGAVSHADGSPLCPTSPTKLGRTMSPPELSGSHLGVMERARGGGEARQRGEKNHMLLLKGIFE